MIYVLLAKLKKIALTSFYKWKKNEKQIYRGVNKFLLDQVTANHY